MPVDEILFNRVRELLQQAESAEEKKMFGGICFMVEEKLCCCVMGNELMCRLSPQDFEESLTKDGVRVMKQNQTLMKGYVLIDKNVLQTKADLTFWINMALRFNPFAKAAKKKAGKSK